MTAPAQAELRERTRQALIAQIKRADEAEKLLAAAKRELDAARKEIARMKGKK